MAENTIKVRRKLRYDHLANWIQADPILLVGEIAITAILGDDNSLQGVMAKVGDGTNHYSDLPFLSGYAADVPAWAKQTNKPTYNATEIEDLDDYINDTITDTNTTYQIVPKTTDPDNKVFYFQSKEKDEETWTTAYTLHIPEDIEYTLSTENPGELTFTPSKGEEQKIQIVEIETDGTQIGTGNDKLPTAEAVSSYTENLLDDALSDLNVQDASVTGQFVTQVRQSDGKIEVTRAQPKVSDISDLVFESTYDASTNKAATMADVKAATARIYRLKGTLDSIVDLPADNNEIGDTYHINDTGAEWAWVDTDDGGFKWEELGRSMDGFVTDDDLTAALAYKQDLITATNKLPVDLVNGTATDEKDGLLSASDKEKLDSIEEAAQENKIDKVIAGDALVPITDKTLTLAKIAITGSVMDLTQDEGDILILDGGNAFGFLDDSPNTLILNGGNSST